MTDEWLPPGDLEISIQDSALPLDALEDLVAQFTVVLGAEVRIVNRWGGPAAGGPGWGGPEIAVMIMVGEILRRGASDAYSLLKHWIGQSYTRIRTRNGARWYTEGALGLVVEDETKSTRLVFCIPEGLGAAALSGYLDRVQSDANRLLAQWGADAGEIRLVLDAETGDWREHSPPPPEYRVRLK